MDPRLASSIKIQRKDLVPQLNRKRQQDWVVACERLGIWVPVGSGKGSHICGYREPNCDRANNSMLVVTIQKKMYPVAQVQKIKQLVAYGLSSGKYNEEDVWKAFELI